MRQLERGYGVEQMPWGEGMKRAEKEERQADHMEPSEEGFAEDGFGAVHAGPRKLSGGQRPTGGSRRARLRGLERPQELKGPGSAAPYGFEQRDDTDRSRAQLSLAVGARGSGINLPRAAHPQPH